ncbi:MAG: PEP-CTERM sorting domain-containing protein [Acidobacteriaceae bacterium]|nr:PEP-CTERM sorting domain-containing protein [Acidobacteriaceae bacterium]
MRRFVLYLILFLVTIAAAKGVRASTDCERWLVEYRNALAHSSVVQRAKAAHRQFHNYVHGHVGALTKPPLSMRPHLQRAAFGPPRMTREEILRRLRMACGDVPEETVPSQQLIEAAPPPGNFLPGTPTAPIELASLDEGSVAPAYSSSSSIPGAPGFGPGTGYPGFWPAGGGSNGGGGNGGGGGGNPPPIPEPGSIFLILTGLPAMAGFVRCKVRSRCSN